MPLEAVIFGMDGVLTATVDYHYESWRQMCLEYGLPFSREVNDRLRGLTRRRSLETILDGRTYSEQEKETMLRRKNEIFHHLISEMDRSDLLDGAARLLDEIRAAGIRIGVASASRNAGTILEHLRIKEYVEALVDGNSVQRSKPAPDIFLHTSGRLGVLPKACLVIEDSQAGIQAAKAAGMCVIGLGPDERVGEAYAVFPGLGEVRLRDLRAVHASWRNGFVQEAERDSRAARLT